MDFFGTLLWPIKWTIEAILVGFHWLLSQLGMDPAAGLTWVLSIVGLVLVVRAALIPLFVKQIKSQRKMLEVAPQLKKIQDKYRGKKDQFSREAMQRETMALYSNAGTNPLASCLPLLIQMPIFFGLFTVLNEANKSNAGVGLLNAELANQFGTASLFGIAPLHDSITSALENDPVEWVVVVIAVVMVIIMTVTQFITQLQIMSKNQTPEMKESPMYKQQKIMLYVLPFVFIISGVAFPIGVMFYWLTSNVWTMVQQFIVIRNMPTPGSEAALAREARLAKRNRAKGIIETTRAADAAEEAPKPTTTQRQQPVGKARAKKQGPKK
ncbi:membrane protein insertase YidC [Salinibacterium sp. ZJ77]|uniref:membrane protein insertase YidC n=1 Tax=Salinibacterium sp. ZJ77 TaxID=2708337 RepID=UPI001420D3D9|nr:membrane protein insertase YidC [Salinibacterium sp. ZJ77]